MTASPEIQEIAIITGASAGIGAATARELARRGVRRDRDADAIRGPVYRVMQDSQTLARFQAETTARRLSGNSIPRRCKKACKLGAWQPA